MKRRAGGQKIGRDWESRDEMGKLDREKMKGMVVRCKCSWSLEMSLMSREQGVDGRFLWNGVDTIRTVRHWYSRRFPCRSLVFC
jgi:hypothetical protein